MGPHRRAWALLALETELLLLAQPSIAGSLLRASAVNLYLDAVFTQLFTAEMWHSALAPSTSMARGCPPLRPFTCLRTPCLTMNMDRDGVNSGLCCSFSACSRAVFPGYRQHRRQIAQVAPRGVPARNANHSPSRIEFPIISEAAFGALHHPEMCSGTPSIRCGGGAWGWGNDGGFGWPSWPGSRSFKMFSHWCGGLVAVSWRFSVDSRSPRNHVLG